jgi:hypothetical protein
MVKRKAFIPHGDDAVVDLLPRLVIKDDWTAIHCNLPSRQGVRKA